MNNRVIGINIKKYRKIAGLTQEKLAELLNISTVHMSHMECGHVSMSLEKMCIRDSGAVLEQRVVHEHVEAAAALFNHIIVGGDRVGGIYIQRLSVYKHVGHPVWAGNSRKGACRVQYHRGGDGQINGVGEAGHVLESRCV